MTVCSNAVVRPALFAALLVCISAPAAGEDRWKAGHVFRDCADCPEMVVVPAGSYRKGSPPEEGGRNDGEGLQQRVTIPRPFATGRYEVTAEEFARFVNWTGYRTGNSCWTFEDGKWRDREERSWRSPGFDQTERSPAVCVSWHDARAYAIWLSGKTGKRYRLLSESEWEYAARAGTTTSRYWGESASKQCRYANGADAAAGQAFDMWAVTECDDGHVYTAPAGSFEPNGFGLHDMLGNVAEQVEDCLKDRGTRTVRECEYRLHRGGSWIDEPWLLRADERFMNMTGHRNSAFGFRIARTLGH